jgi:NAD(P)-dependent dehydrogenase (short-subunit alcohol dehydrogenase family)
MVRKHGLADIFMSFIGFISVVLDKIWFRLHYITAAILGPFVPFDIIPSATKAVVPTPHGRQCVVLVTGTSSGIGRDTTLHLAQIGYHVFAGVRKIEDGDLLMDEFESRMRGVKRTQGHSPRGRIAPVLLDVSSPENIEDTYNTIEEYLQRTSAAFVGLINNAGIVPIGPVEILSDSTSRSVFETNFFGALHLTRRMMPLLRCTPGSRVICIGSVAAWVPTMGMGLYSATKAALHALVTTMDEEVRHMGVRVLLIEPGLILSRATLSFPKTMAGNSLSSNPTLVVPKPPEIPNREEKAMEQYSYIQTRWVNIWKNLNLLSQPTKEVVVDITHALQSSRPLRVYYAGMDAKISALTGRMMPSLLFSTSGVMKFMGKLGL